MIRVALPKLIRGGLVTTTTYSRRERGAIAAYSAMYGATMALPPRRDFYPQFPATVNAVQDLAPAFRRVTLQAAPLRGLTLLGPDEYVGLYLPSPGVDLYLPEDSLNPRPALSRLPVEVRPDLRWYTIRAHRRAHGEVDIDIVSKGHDGPGARWIGRVRVDDSIGLRIGSAPYASAPRNGHHVLLADETGLPGALAVLDASARLPTSARPQLTVLLEVPGQGHLPDDAHRAGIDVVYRGEGAPGSALLPALSDLALGRPDYAWVCAEAATIAGARRHLVKERCMSRRKVMASGFWKVGSERL